MRRTLPIVFVAALCVAAPVAAATGRAADDPLQGQEWWLHDVGADQAAAPGPGVPVVIVDSGVDPSHPEFSSRANTTFLNDQTVNGPEEWHGSVVASLAAAPANGVGIVGVYPQAALQSWDASAAPGGLFELTVVQGIEAVAQHCPAVINLSFGSTDQNPVVQDAILTAVRAGCLVVAAAGNNGQSGQRDFPAAYPHVLTVGASDQADHVASFSSVGPWVDLVAPGVGMVGAVPLSHDPSGYSTTPMIGTSFSAPIVSAAAAWIWTLRPTLDAGQLAALLKQTARDIGTPGWDPASGWGLLDIPAAIAAPTPPRDPQEPNDDVNEVKPGAVFATGEPALTTAAQPSSRIAASLDENKDPRDLYRIWVPAHRVLRVTATNCAAARIWGPQTFSVDESVGSRRRDLKGTVLRGGNTGFAAYVEVLLTGRARTAQYVLSVQSSKR